LLPVSAIVTTWEWLPEMFVDFVPIPDLFSPRENKSWLGKKSELYELLIDRV